MDSEREFKQMGIFKKENLKIINFGMESLKTKMKM